MEESFEKTSIFNWKNLHEEAYDLHMHWLKYSERL